MPGSEGALLTIPGWGSHGHADARTAGTSGELRPLPSKVSIASPDTAVAVKRGTAQSSDGSGAEGASCHLARSGPGETAAVTGIGRPPGKRLADNQGSGNCRHSDRTTS